MTLALAAAIYGALTVFVFRRFTNAAALRVTVNRILAHVIELGLFLESPSLVFQAQRDLLRGNLRLLRLIILPAVIMALLFVPVTMMYGRAPLPIGEASVVTVQMKDAAMPTVRLEAPEGIVVETPGVRIPRQREISWRVRRVSEGSGEFLFHVENRIVKDALFVHDGSIRSIHVRYPAASMLGVSWLVWFIITSSFSALVVGLCV